MYNTFPSKTIIVILLSLSHGDIVMSKMSYDSTNAAPMWNLVIFFLFNYITPAQPFCH